MSRRPSDAEISVLKMKILISKAFPMLDLAQATIAMVQDPSVSGLSKCIKAFRKVASNI